MLFKQGKCLIFIIDNDLFTCANPVPLNVNLYRESGWKTEMIAIAVIYTLIVDNVEEASEHFNIAKK
jgi:hypothetical protein